MIEVRSEQEIINLSIEYALRVLELQKQKAELDLDIKAIKIEGKLDGVPIGLVNKSLNKIKKEMKQTETDKAEEDAWFEVFSSNEKIKDKIAEINNI
jgi:uncharacterized protein (UPF0335 family)